MDKSKDYAAKEVHLNNLNRIVNFCENIHECRRVLQLEYFGEHFTSEECLQNRESSCDNCLRRKDVKMLDITKECKLIMNCVREVCGNRNRFTLLYITDLLKGCSVKKIVDNNHNKTKFWGSLKTWEKSEIERILRKMVVEQYLREELIFSKDIPQAYLYLGPNVNQLMCLNSKTKIEFAIKSNSKSLKSTSSTGSPQLFSKTLKGSKELTSLQQNCYNEILDLCQKISQEKNINLASIMNIQALKAMSDIFPETEEEFKKIPHVTNTNYLKYGKDLLAITKTYALQKTFLLDDEEMDEDDEDLINIDLSGIDYQNTIDWEKDAFSAKASASTSSGYRGRVGFKRKRNYKNSTSKRSKASTSKKKGYSWTSKVTKGRTKTSRSGKSLSSNAPNLLPIPGFR